MAGESDFNLLDSRSGAENSEEEGTTMEEKLKVSGFESTGNQVRNKKAGSKHKPAGINKSSKRRSGNKRAPETATENSSAVFKKRRSGFEERSGSDLEGGNGGLKEKTNDGKPVIEKPTEKTEKDKFAEGVVEEEDWSGDKRELRPRKKQKQSLSNLLLHDIKLTEADARRIIGRRIKVFWPLDDDWYFGRVESFDGNKKRHHVVYEDGDEEWLELGKEKFKIQVYPGDVFGKAASEARRGKLEAQRVDSNKKNGRKSADKPVSKKNGRKRTDGPVKKRNGRKGTDALADDRKKEKGGPPDDRKDEEEKGEREEDGKNDDIGEDENRLAKEKDDEDAKNPISLRQMFAVDRKKKKGGPVDDRKEKGGKGQKEEDGKNNDIEENEKRETKEKDEEDAKKPISLRQMLADDRKKKKGGPVDDRKDKEGKEEKEEEDGKNKDIGEDENQPSKEKDAKKPISLRQTAPRSKRARSTKQYNQKQVGQNQTEGVNVMEESVEDTSKQDVDSDAKVQQNVANVGFCRSDDTDCIGGGRQHYEKQVDDLPGNGGIPEVQQSDLSEEKKINHTYEKDLHQSKEIDENKSDEEPRQTMTLDENEPSVIQPNQSGENQAAEIQHSNKSEQVDEIKMSLETRPKLTSQVDLQQSDIRGSDEKVDEKRSYAKSNDEKVEKKPAHLDLASELGKQQGTKKQRSRVVRTRDSILAQTNQSTLNVEGQSASRQYLQFSPSREGQPANRHVNLQ